MGGLGACGELRGGGEGTVVGGSTHSATPTSSQARRGRNGALSPPRLGDGEHHFGPRLQADTVAEELVDAVQRLADLHFYEEVRTALIFRSSLACGRGVAGG